MLEHEWGWENSLCQGSLITAPISHRTAACVWVSGCGSMKPSRFGCLHLYYLWSDWGCADTDHKSQQRATLQRSVSCNMLPHRKQPLNHNCNTAFCQGRSHSNTNRSVLHVLGPDRLSAGVCVCVCVCMRACVCVRACVDTRSDLTWPNSYLNPKKQTTNSFESCYHLSIANTLVLSRNNVCHLSFVR